MAPDANKNYRQRIYANYENVFTLPIAPTTLAGLAPRLRYFCWMILPHCPPNKASPILDLGCGHGALLYALRTSGYTNVHGVDSSIQQVEAARRLGIGNV